MTDVRVSIHEDEWYPVYSVSEIDGGSITSDREDAYTLTAREIKAGRKVESAFADWQNQLHRLVTARRIREEAAEHKQALEAAWAAARAKEAAKAERRRAAKAAKLPAPDPRTRNLDPLNPQRGS